MHSGMARTIAIYVTAVATINFVVSYLKSNCPHKTDPFSVSAMIHVYIATLILLVHALFPMGILRR